MALLVKIGADLRDFDKKMKKLSSDIGYVGKKFQNAGTDLTKAFTVPAVAIGGASIKISAGFEEAMSEVKAISGATGDDFEALKNTAKDLGETTAYSASEAAAGMKYLAMAGWDTNQIISAMPGMLDLAAASGTDLATTADIVSDAMTGFKMESSEAAHFADVLATASSKANTNVDMLGESFKYAAPVAGSFGYSVEDTTAALAVMANSGIKGSQAGTTLRSALLRMSEGAGDAGVWMEKLGIEMANADGSMKPLGDVVSQLKTSFSGLSDEEQILAANALFGKQAVSGMLSIVGDNEGVFESLSTEMQGTSGVAEEMANTKLDNLNGQLTLLKSALEGAAISIGESLMPMIKGLVEKIQSWASWFNGLNETQQQTIIKIAAVVAAIGPLLIITGKGIAMFGKIKAAITLLMPVLAGISTPVLAVIGVIGALIAVGVLLYKHWDEVKAFAIKIWDGISDFFRTSIDGIAGFFVGLKDSVANTLQGLFDKISGWKDKVCGVFTKLKEKITGVFDGIKSIFSNFKLPSFSLSKKTVSILGKSITYPTGFKINWHADGGIFTRPTILGGHGFGEAGPEAILPLSKLPGLLNLDKNNKITIYLDGRKIYEGVDSYLGSKVLGQGGV